jgi:hypothetical protein
VYYIQGGLLTGKDPSAFNTADPLRLWIIQVGEYSFLFHEVGRVTLEGFIYSGIGADEEV